MHIKQIDHFVLTVKNIDTTIDFYTNVLGMEVERFNSGGVVRTAMKFGRQKINLHQVGKEFSPRADTALPGTADFCLITDVPINQVHEHLISCNIKIIEGPVAKTGAEGPLMSVYIRDPDNNLVEISNQM